MQLGFSPLQVGIIATTTLFGSGLLTLLIGLHAYRYHYRTSAVGGDAADGRHRPGVCGVDRFRPLLLIALIGTLNPRAATCCPCRSSMRCYPLVDDRKRTAVFARYASWVRSRLRLGRSLRQRRALLQASTDIRHAALQLMFVLYACSPDCRRLFTGDCRARWKAKRASRKHRSRSPKNVYTLAALFSLDAFGGGFVVQSMVALWLYQRFSLSLAVTSTVFF